MVGQLVADAPMDELRAYLRWSYLRGVARMLAKPIADESFAFNSASIRAVSSFVPTRRTRRRYCACASRVLVKQTC